MITRRHALRNLALAAGAYTTSPILFAADPDAPSVFKLPPLPYDFDALEPHLDAGTMQIHHDKHHAGYVAKLNTAVAAAPGFETKTIEQVLTSLPDAPEEVRDALRNHGGGHYNHSLFWQMIKKDGGGEPKAEVAKAIDAAFGSFTTFQEAFTTTAGMVFGSGWAWLVSRGGTLSVVTTPNQDSPITDGGFPLLGIDLWEHAYYLKYQNQRADYVRAFQNVINWDFVSERYGLAAK